MVVAYASRFLSKTEQQFSPYLLEMRAMVWATQHFKEHLRGQCFIQFTDHKPLQTCADAPSVKTLSDLQLLALEFDFVIQHKKGINIPADLLSRSGIKTPINAVQLTPHDLATQQEEDHEIQSLIAYRANGRWPTNLRQSIHRVMAQLEPHFTTDIH